MTKAASAFWRNLVASIVACAFGVSACSTTPASYPLENLKQQAKRATDPRQIVENIFLATYPNPTHQGDDIYTFKSVPEVLVIKKYLEPALFEPLMELARASGRASKKFDSYSPNDQVHLGWIGTLNAFVESPIPPRNVQIEEKSSSTAYDVVVKGVYDSDGGGSDDRVTTFQFVKHGRTWMLRDVYEEGVEDETHRPAQLSMTGYLQTCIADIREMERSQD